MAAKVLYRQGRLDHHDLWFASIDLILAGDNISESSCTRLSSWRFVAIGLLGMRLPVAVIVGYSLHGLWDLLHELQAHGAYSAFQPGQLTAIPLAIPMRDWQNQGTCLRFGRACKSQTSASRISGGGVEPAAEEAQTQRAGGTAAASLDGGEPGLGAPPDFAHDAVASGRTIRVLSLMDA